MLEQPAKKNQKLLSRQVSSERIGASAPKSGVRILDSVTWVNPHLQFITKSDWVIKT